MKRASPCPWHGPLNQWRLIMAAQVVDGELYIKIDGQLFEIKRQLRQTNGYPFDPNRLSRRLQSIISGEAFREPIPQRPEYLMKFIRAFTLPVCPGFTAKSAFFENANVRGADETFRRLFYGFRDSTTFPMIVRVHEIESHQVHDTPMDFLGGWPKCQLSLANVAQFLNLVDMTNRQDSNEKLGYSDGYDFFVKKPHRLRNYDGAEMDGVVRVGAWWSNGTDQNIICPGQGWYLTATEENLWRDGYRGSRWVSP